MSSTIYVRLKSDVTRYKERYETEGMVTFRVRMNCGFCFPKTNSRNGILVINPRNERVVSRVIRCKKCEALSKGGEE